MVPADFDSSTLPESERRVLGAFVETTPPDWLLVPTLQLNDRGADREIELLVMSPTGVFSWVEVKCGCVTVDGQRWSSYGHRIKNPAPRP